MKKDTYIILPLADNEKRRVETTLTLFETSTSELKFPYNHVFFSEIGKLFHHLELVKFKFRTKPMCMRRYFGIIQNRRYFKNMEDLRIYSNNEVILANEEWLGGKTIKTQFKCCHPNYCSIYEDILKKYKFNENILSHNMMSPHNIFLSRLDFFLDYGEFLEEVLMNYFDEKYTEKIGAWISERLLHLFANEYFKVKHEPIITLQK